MMTEQKPLVRRRTEGVGVYRENGVPKAPGGFKTVEQGAATSVWCAVSPQLNDKGGGYCDDCDIAQLDPADDKGSRGVRPYAVDRNAAAARWELSERLTNIRFSL